MAGASVQIPVEDTGMVKVDKQIKDCSETNLFNFLSSHFAIFFIDLQEMNKFISYLYEKKKEEKVGNLLKNFNDIMKEFRMS